MKRVALIACALAAVGYALVALLAFVPVFPFSMLEHFRVQYLLVGIPVAAASAWTRWFDVALIALLVNLAIVTPDLGASATTKQGTPVRLLFANVHASNTEYHRVATLIAETKPDIVALVEMRAPWFAALAPALAGYERVEHDRDDNFGLGLYVRGSLTGGAEHIGGTLPTIVAAVALAKGPRMTIVVTHPWPPVSAWTKARQEEHLAVLAHRVRTMSGPIVLAGDLNATPWSRSFRSLIRTTELCDTRAGFGYQGSYPASSVIVRIPIDHVLVSCDIGVMDRVIERDVGSDHLPVLVDLAF